MILILIIFIPIFSVLIANGVNQHKNAVVCTEGKTRQLFQIFIREQTAVINQTRQFLELLSQIPSIRNLDYDEGNEFLQSIHQYYPQYSTIVVSNADGIIDICAVPGKTPIDVNDRSWFNRIKESRQFVIDSFLISRSANVASLPFAFPVLDDEGELEIAIGAAFGLNYYETLFNEYALPKGSEIIITDRIGTILYNASNQDLTGSSLAEVSEITLPKDQGGNFRAAGSTGAQYLYWYESITAGLPDNEIFMFIGIPEQEVFAEANRSVFLNLLLTALLAVLSMFSAQLFSGRFVLKPVRFLLDKTERVKKGDLSLTRSDIKLPEELQRLSTAFDLMTETLQERETALLDNGKRMSILFDKAADAIFVSDESGKLLQVNNQALMQTGFSEEEILEKSVHEIDGELSTPEAFNQLIKSFDAAEIKVIETTHLRKDGSSYPVEITISKFITRDGSRVMGIARDITNRKKWQTRIEKTLAEKEILLRELYHRTNNNMQVIRSALELNAHKYDSPATKELIQNTGNRIEAMSLVHQMLYQAEDLSRIRLDNYIIELSENIIRELYEYSSAVTLEYDLQNIKVLVDTAVPLGLVLTELITNSCKHAFTGRSGGNIKFTLKHEDVRIVIILADNGVGFDADSLADSGGALSENIGLAISRGIITDQLMGTISFESASGTICTITLPEAVYDGPSKNRGI